MSDSDDSTKPDMTRIEDLSEFLHEEDPEADALLDIPPTPDQDEDDEEDASSFQTMSLNELDEDDDDSESESEPPGFEATEENDFGNDFSSESTQPDFQTPEEFQTSSSEEDLEPLEEIQEIEEESKLEEEVENEIQEALEEDSDNSFEAGSFEDDSEFGFQSDDDENDFGSSNDESDFGDSFEMSDDEDDTEDSEEDNEALEMQSEEVSQEDEEDGPETEDDFEPMNEPEAVEVEVSAPAPTPMRSTPRETFKDINEFGNAISYGQVSAGGNPPYSIILRRIKYLEDSERIIEILREHGLCDEANEADYQQGLNNGSILISQISEYSAIFLAHKFRRFDLEILVGLADEIHPSKNYDMDYKGLVRKENLRQNKNESFSLEDQMIEVESILLATTPTLENYRIDRYLGLVSSHIMLDEEEFQRLQENDSSNNEVDPDKILEQIEQEMQQDEASKTAAIEIGLEEIYSNLAEGLKAKAYKLKGNAVVGINYQITPLINHKAGDSAPSVRYKISCTGNVVWVGGKEAPRSEA